MENKRGFLLAEETLKIVLAVVCIIGLGYLLVSLYFSYSNSQDLKVAKGALDRLIISLNDKEASYDIIGPNSARKWYVISWPYEGLMPESCVNLGVQNCICICKNGANDVLTSWTNSGFLSDCNDLGYCLSYSKNILVSDSDGVRSRIIVTSSSLKLKMNYTEEEVRVYY
jgi:hypothetical protein